MNENLQTVVEQARSLTDFTAEDEAVLQEARAELIDLGPELAVAFYDQLFGYPPTRKIFEDLNQDRQVREKTLAAWYASLFEGRYDQAFWEQQWRVGLVHIRFQVSNLLMLSMMSRVQSVLLQRCWERFEPDSAEQVAGSLLRLTNCISAVIAEGYHQQAMEAIERAGLRRSLVDRIVALEARDLLARIRPEGKDPPP